MKKLLLIFSFILYNNIYAQQLQVSQPIRFLALGDSYTIGQSVEASQNWPNQLYARLSAAGYSTEKIQIIAQTGWRTDVLANAIVNENPPSDFNLVSLLIGVNDQYQGKPFSGYEPAFMDLITTAVALAGGHKEHVFIVSIPDYAYTPFGGGNQNISNDIDAYNAVNKSIAEDYGITYFDITPISREGLNEPDLVASDNLHPSALQYERWVDLMMEEINKNNTLNNTPSSNNKKKVLLYPNPANQTLNLAIDNPYTDSEYTIHNGIGTLLLSGQIDYSTPQINISTLSKGSYYLILNNTAYPFLVAK